MRKLFDGGRFAAIAAAIMLSACGGGGDSGGDTGNGGSGSGSGSAVVVPPSITMQPQSQSVTTDKAATFSVAATGTNLSYQWQVNGTPIAGATSQSLTTPPATYTDDGAQYSVMVANAAGTVTSAVAPLTLKLSANQKVFEDLILGPDGASYMFHWNLNLSGSQSSGLNFFTSDSATLAHSPLVNGTQTTVEATQTSSVNMTTTLAMATFWPTRILKNGAVLVIPTTESVGRTTYVGDDVRVDTLASDGATVVLSQIRSNYVVVPLTGTIAGTPADFAHYHNSIFANPAILKPAAVYAPGAAYVKYTSTNNGDRYTAFDCGASTRDANISPCVVGSTLQAALTAGLRSDDTTYHLTEGSLSTVDGVPMWVANAARPKSATMSFTEDYRVYFQLGGNVYTGALVRDGTVLGGSYYVSNPSSGAVATLPTFLPFGIRMNKAARDSIAAAVAI